MKRVVIIVFIGLLICTAILYFLQKKTNKPFVLYSRPISSNAEPTTSIEFSEYKFDFGYIKMGDTVSHDFIFKNTGNIPLIINKVTASCGCTITEYTTEPVLPSKFGRVSVRFNSSNKSGSQFYNILVHGNIINRSIPISFRAFVE
ncbi:MAG: DUF1573 domain-containing protein [Chitinophagales bacterium]|nr:DUF1573 domain-containing protein [Chitinophagales bacterium]